MDSRKTFFAVFGAIFAAWILTSVISCIGRQLDEIDSMKRDPVGYYMRGGR